MTHTDDDTAGGGVSFWKCSYATDKEVEGSYVGTLKEKTFTILKQISETERTTSAIWNL